MRGSGSSPPLQVPPCPLMRPRPWLAHAARRPAPVWGLQAQAHLISFCMFRYTEALSALPTVDGRHRLLANRSLAYLRGKRAEDALADAQAGAITRPACQDSCARCAATQRTARAVTTLSVALPSAGSAVRFTWAA